MKLLISAALLLLSIGGCNTWERNTYQTLSASKAVLDTAQKDYSTRTIPQTHCAYFIINDAKTADAAAVTAMVVYEQLKVTKGNTSAQEAIVTTDLAALAPLVVQLQALIADPAGKCNAAADAAAVQRAKREGPTQQ